MVLSQLCCHDFPQNILEMVNYQKNKSSVASVMTQIISGVESYIPNGSHSDNEIVN